MESLRVPRQANCTGNNFFFSENYFAQFPLGVVSRSRILCAMSALKPWARNHMEHRAWV